MTSTASALSQSAGTDRATINRENAQHSTGPRTEAGKQRSALNALTHGLTSRTALLPAEDLAAYQNHCQQLRDEYQPKTPTETQIVQEIADTPWRLNPIPLLEADLLARAANPPTEEAAIACPNSSTKRSNSSARSNTTAARANSATSKTPPPSWNSISTKGFRGSQPTMASFLQKTRWNARHNA